MIKSLRIDNYKIILIIIAFIFFIKSFRSKITRITIIETKGKITLPFMID